MGISLWKPSYKRLAKDEFLRSRTRYMGYAEYASWISKAVPELELRPLALSAEETAAEQSGLTGLELLRLLNKLKAPPKGVPEITPEEKQLAEEALYGSGRPDEVVASRFSVEVTRRQMECLRPGEWLNDEVINFYYKLLQERGKSVEGSPKCWFTNSFFWPKLSGNNSKDYNYKEVRRWTVKAKVDIFEMDYVIFPMNIGESHWAMGAIDLKEKGFRYFDSMFSKPPSNFVAFLRRYLQDEHKAKKGKEISGVEDWQLLVPSKVPQQKNGYDCGVFTCFFADCFSAGKSLSFEQEDMPTLRMRIAARVLKADEKFDPIP
ncbi:Putative ubiquitin-like-specific protease 1B [Durusdinium trenchii]